MIWRRGNYSENTVDMILNQIAFGKYFQNGEWYVGVTANAVQSLTAHGFAGEEIFGRTFGFAVWDIPAENAVKCKREILKLYKNTSCDDESDFLSDKFANLFIYAFEKKPNLVTHIDVSGFTPVKTLPENPVWITEKSRDGTVTRKFYDHDFSEEEFAYLLEHFREVFLNGTLATLVIQHRSICEMWVNYGERCCRISYDAHTSQEGGYASWRNGSKARKPVKFFVGEYPAYMVCTDVEQYMTALSYFLKNDRKPAKRQNVLWAWIKEDKFPKNK